MLWSRKQLALANWCALTDHSIDAVGDLLGLSPRCVRVIQDFSSSHDTGFFKDSDTRYRSFWVLTIASGSTPIAPQASRKACSFFSVNSFIMYLLRRKNAISILSAYSNTFAAFWPFRFPGLRSACIL